MQKSNRLLATRLFSIKEDGGLEQASRELVERSEAQIVRWVQFRAGVLFFTLVPGDPESGAIFIFSRRDGVLYSIDFDDEKWGGYTLEDYTTLEKTHRLCALAQRPRLLARWARRT